MSELTVLGVTALWNRCVARLMEEGARGALSELEQALAPSPAVREVVEDIRLVRNWFAAVERCGTPITLTPEQARTFTANLNSALDRLAKEVNRE